MHFHNPSVPIYDSYAESSLRSLVRWNKELEAVQIPVEGDTEYAWYVMRFLDLYSRVASKKLPLNVKQLDH
jgi:hypothetical protein